MGRSRRPRPYYIYFGDVFVRVCMRILKVPFVCCEGSKCNSQGFHGPLSEQEIVKQCGKDCLPPRVLGKVRLIWRCAFGLCTILMDWRSWCDRCEQQGCLDASKGVCSASGFGVFQTLLWMKFHARSHGTIGHALTMVSPFFFF